MQKARHYLQNNQNKKNTEGMAQAEEWLPSQDEALSSNPNAAKKEYPKNKIKPLRCDVMIW
jgi:hypothetical protein